MVSFLEYLSEQVVNLLDNLILFSQNLLVELFFLFENGVGLCKNLFISFGFVMVEIGEVLEEQYLIL
jgi:hypothetical protein